MQQSDEPKSVPEFLKKVGRSNFQSFTGFLPQGVTRAKQEGVFPDAWFWRVREFCKVHGFKTPEQLFRSYEDFPKAGDGT